MAQPVYGNIFGATYPPPAAAAPQPTSIYNSIGSNDVLDKIQAIVRLYDSALFEVTKAVAVDSLRQTPPPSLPSVWTGMNNVKMGDLYIGYDWLVHKRTSRFQNQDPIVPNPRLRLQDRELELSKEIDDYDQKIRELTQRLMNLRLQGRKPNGWGDNQDSLLSRCCRILESCQKYASDPNYNSPDRAVDWHFRGPIEVMTALKAELIACTTVFSGWSTMVNIRGPDTALNRDLRFEAGP